MRLVTRLYTTPILLSVGLGGSMPAFATNGMNLEGYGPVAAGMGGASMAYDNGTAAVMNNPATLGLAQDGNRLDAALGFLGPTIEASIQGPAAAKSSSDAFYMPAFGFTRKAQGLTYGFGVFAQGGMGAQYDATSWMADPSQGANTALTQKLVNRSEVSVGRFVLPVALELTPNVHIASSLDFVWAGMDVQMAMSQAQFVDLVSTQQGGQASGTFVNAFGALFEPFGGTGVQNLHHAYFDFSDDSAFTGEAKGTGFAAKVGAVFKVNERLSLGAAYHSKTGLSDLESSNATLAMGVNMDTGIAAGGAPSGTYANMIIPVSGKITVRNFEWPETYGIGAAFKATDRLMLAMDVKRINWAAVMKDFTMTFEADNVAANGGFAGLGLDATLFQNWEDQTVVALGGGFQVTDGLVVRAGYNYASNPVPDQYLNALFPAIIDTHYTVGAGYRFGGSSVDVSMTMAPEVKATNPGNGSTIPAVTTTHSQTNWQFMYSYRW